MGSVPAVKLSQDGQPNATGEQADTICVFSKVYCKVYCAAMVYSPYRPVNSLRTVTVFCHSFCCLNFCPYLRVCFVLQSLASIIWSLSELQLQPPPAWLYHWAASARGVLDSLNPVDLGQVAAALQGPTFRPLELPKLEALLSDVLDKLTEVETASGAYSKAAVHMLLKIEGSRVQQPGGSSGRGGSRVRRVVLGSSNGSRGLNASGVGSNQHGLENAAVVSGAGIGPVAAVQHSQGVSGSGSSSSSSSSSYSSSIVGHGMQGRQAEEVAQLKEYLVERSVMDASSSLDDVPDLDLEQWSTAAESQ